VLAAAPGQLLEHLVLSLKSSQLYREIFWSSLVDIIPFMSGKSSPTRAV